MSTMLKFDPTGLLPANRASNELHTLDLGDARIIQPRNGSMYWKTVTVTVSTTGEVLSPGNGLEAFRYDPEVSAIAGGQEVVYGIVISDNTVAGDLLLNGQYVGGYEGRGRAALEELIELIRTANTGPIDWSRVRAPATFRPDPAHKHNLTSIRELEKLTLFAQDMAEGFKNNARLGKTGNVLNSRLDRVLGILVGMQDSLNKISAKGFDAVTEEQLGEVSETVDAVVEMLLQTNIEMFTMNSRLSTLEEVMQDFFHAFNLNMGEMEETIDVVPGSDYLAAGNALVNAILLYEDSALTAAYSTLFGGPFRGQVTITDNKVEYAQSSEGFAFSAQASCIRTGTPFYFEMETISFPNNLGVGDYDGSTVKVGFGMPLKYHGENTISTTNGAAAVLMNTPSQNMIRLTVSDRTGPMSLSGFNSSPNPPNTRVGVSYDPATREVELRIVSQGDFGYSDLPGSAPTLVMQATDAENPNDLNILIFGKLTGSEPAVDQTLTFYTQESDFMISAIPAGFTALADTDFSIVPYNLSISPT